MTDCRKEFPRSWFARAKLAKKQRDKSLNYFGVDASQPLSVWRKKGWIYRDDPRGWFQWYCRYYMGRRIADEDARQIKRWKAIRRHVRQIERNCEPGDVTLPTAAAPSLAALGLRQPEDLARAKRVRSSRLVVPDALQIGQHLAQRQYVGVFGIEIK